MSKFCSNPVFDAALTKISTATQMVATSGQPATYAAATSGALSQATMAPADFTIANGDVSGRKVVVAAKSGLAVVAAGTVDHISLLDPVTTTLLYVTTCPAQAIVAGGTVSLASWQVEINQPT
jgi:hypothetical protein